jgi:lysophospholipase L1-like esterase
MTRRALLSCSLIVVAACHGLADGFADRVDGESAPPAASPEEREPAPTPAPTPPAYVIRDGDPRTAEHPISDPTGSLVGFYRALARTDDGEAGAITRVTHMGDSSIGMDQLPHYLRRRFQDRFGDGGTGFVLVQPHSTSYRNNTVHLGTPRRWQFCFLIFRCFSDGHYGLGGVATTGSRGSTTVIETRRDGAYGTTASRLELWYAAQRRGGRLGLRVDGDPEIVLDTSSGDAEGAPVEDRFHRAALVPGSHRVRVRHVGGGPARAYGVVLETDGPGVVWDTLSMIGAFTTRLLEYDEAHFAGQLRARDPSLVVLNYGGNDLRRYVGRGVRISEFQEETRQVLARFRSASPDAGCLLTGIIEHEMSGRSRIRPEHVQAVVDAQRAAAHEAGCAFFDVYAAMGGAGSYRRWMREGRAASDLKHLNPAGRRIVADWIYEGLVSGYVAWRTGT